MADDNSPERSRSSGWRSPACDHGRCGSLTSLGLLACGFYAIHGAYHLSRDQPENLLWVCHLASLMIGVGLMIRVPAFGAVGVLILCVGCPLWVLSLLGGDEFLPTSLLTHVGGLVVGLIGLNRLGLPRGVWWKATLAVGALLGLSRLLPPDSNVNLSHGPWSGWETWYPVPWLYDVQLLLQWCLALLVVELVLRGTKWTCGRTGNSGTGT